jgi:hypothetical protein
MLARQTVEVLAFDRDNTAPNPWIFGRLADTYSSRAIVSHLVAGSSPGPLGVFGDVTRVVRRKARNIELLRHTASRRVTLPTGNVTRWMRRPPRQAPTQEGTSVPVQSGLLFAGGLFSAVVNNGLVHCQAETAQSRASGQNYGGTLSTCRHSLSARPPVFSAKNRTQSKALVFGPVLGTAWHGPGAARGRRWHTARQCLQSRTIWLPRGSVWSPFLCIALHDTGFFAPGGVTACKARKKRNRPPNRAGLGPGALMPQRGAMEAKAPVRLGLMAASQDTGSFTTP